MALNKKLAAFISNWIGVFIAVAIVVVATVLGSVYVYARIHIGEATKFTTQSIFVTEEDCLTIIDNGKDQQEFVFQLTLLATNPFKYTVDVSISEVTIDIGELQFPLTQTGDWEQNVSNGVVIFIGTFVMEKSTFETLQEKVAVKIMGTIASHGRYLGVSSSDSRPIEIKLNVSFSFTTSE
ncbi:MAG: hypothetical protein FWH42_05190 [Dehalococcoidia bacterium]|nr:hypothetical protein [Dehalococcoidia bacterium]